MVVVQRLARKPAGSSGADSSRGRKEPTCFAKLVPGGANLLILVPPERQSKEKSNQQVACCCCCCDLFLAFNPKSPAQLGAR